MASTTVTGSIILLALCGHLHAITTPESAFKDVLEDVSSCKDSCERTFPDHTYPESNHLPACQRGCRLFSIMEFAEEDDIEDFNITKQMCNEACDEAYKDNGEMYACHLGCQNEVPFALQKRKELMSEEPSVHILTPILAIQSMCDRFSQFARYRLSSWLVYMQGDNGQLYIFESQPEIDIFTVDPNFQAELDFGKTYNNLETNLEVLNDQDSTDYPQRDDLADESYGWLDCVSKKSGLPRWLLGITVLLSALAMIWLCCATTATAPDHRVSPKKVAIYNDLAYLQDSKKKFIHPVFIKSIPAKAVVARADDDDDELLILEDIKPQQTKI